MVKFPKISQMAVGTIRMTTKFYDGEHEYEVDIYNIQGEDKQKVLDFIAEINNREDIDDLEKVNIMYSKLLDDYTSLVVDVTDVTKLMDNSNHTLSIILNEINIMLCEIQYEQALAQLVEVKKFMISTVAEDMINESEKFKRDKEREYDRIKRVNRMNNKRKVRKFVK